MATDAEVFGGKALSDADVFGPTSTEDSFGTKARLVGQDVARRAGDVLQLPAAVGDMILGAPANIVGRVKGAGAAINEFLQGGKRSEMEAADTAARNLGAFESFKTPFQSAVKSLTGAEHYDQRIVEEAFTAASEAVAKKSGGVLTAHGVEMLLGSTLDALGVKGISPTVKAARARAIESAAKRDLAKRPPPEGALTDAEVFAEPKPDLSSIPEPVEVTPKVLKEIFAKAKDPVNAVDNLFAAAREGRLPLKPLEPVKPGEIGAEAGKVEKGNLPDESIIIGDSATTGMRKIILGEEPTLTAEERIALQDVIKPRQLVDSSGKPFARGQEGKASPEFIAAMASLGITGAALTYVMDKHPEILQAIGQKLHQILNTDAHKQRREQEKLRKNDEEWKRWNDRYPVENEEGNGLAGAEDFLGPLAVGMAVKGKGGMWHPEAVSRLAQPLKEKFAATDRVISELQRDFAHDPIGGESHIAPKREVATNVDRMIRSYLNKHAGTETDPLKDVEVPFGEGVKRWEELTDRAFHKIPAKRFQRYEAMQNEDFSTFAAYDGNLNKVSKSFKTLDEARDWVKENPSDAFKGVPPEEPVWLQTESASTLPARKWLESYLSHVGDFLRQNVDPAKLGQYDLVRAVKETAANDARVAKEMERASSESTKQLPVYKDYGDGMKWVELKLPEGEVKGVIKVDSVRGKGEPDYVAVDVAGKPIKNSYTQEEARGRTPAEAKLAGWLAEEGNALGHCVGGYCDAVASGESKIYSLRDAKGKSHVTVEVSPPDVRAPHNSPEHFARMKGGKLLERYNEAKKGMNEVPLNREIIQSPEFQQWIRSNPGDILQIKGKQNRAPVAAYLPYVQDFVRQAPDGSPAKWGEVGDLEGTGLHDTGPSRNNSIPYNQLAEEFHPGQRFITKADFEKLQEEGVKRTIAEQDAAKARRQAGSADLELTAAIAAAGGLAAYFAANPEEADSLKYGAMLGAAGLGGKIKSGAGRFAGGLDYALGALSTRLGNISPALRLRAREYERRVMETTENTLTKVTPMLAILKDTKEGSRLDMALLNGDDATIKAEMSSRPNGAAAWKATQEVLDSFEQTHKSLGRFREGITTYFPRIVKDLEGLKQTLGQEQKTSLEEALTKAEAKMIKERGRGLTEVETSIIVNNSLQAKPPGSHLPGYAHGRKVEVVTPELRPFYESPVDSFLRYSSAAIQDIEMAKFFGKDLATKKLGSKVMTDTDASIGNIVGQELKAGNMTHKQANELRTLLKARFEGGEKTPNAAVQDIRNATNIALLGQFGSAATQIGDSMMTVYHHGLMPTLKAVKGKLTGDSQVTTREFGLVNHIAEELGSNRWTGKALQGVFKASGFSAIDQFAKGLNLNAGLLKNQSLAQTAAGRAKLAQKWGQAFGEEFPQLLDDLANKRVTDSVKSLLFSELSDAQPITKAEMPQAYLEHPNGRVMYQMKTYMLKQMDVIRRDAYEQIRDGNYVTGAKNLVAVASALALSNIPGDVIKNWISGRDADLDKIDYVENLLRNFGVSRYSMDQAGAGKPLEVGRDMVLPPYKHYQELYNALKPGATDREERKGVKYVPLVGRAVYDRELGGNEARVRAERLRERIRLRDELESQNPELRQRRLERKARREAKMRGAQ